jgi:hypothetical protein
MQLGKLEAQEEDIKRILFSISEGNMLVNSSDIVRKPFC